jgi:hypothetical protein
MKAIDVNLYGIPPTELSPKNLLSSVQEEDPVEDSA